VNHRPIPPALLLPSTVDAVKQGEEFQLISPWLWNIFRKLPIQAMQTVQTASAVASKRGKRLTKTSIGRFGIIEMPRLSFIRLLCTTLDAGWSTASEFRET
jgi:hypothetical protein